MKRSLSFLLILFVITCQSAYSQTIMIPGLDAYQNGLVPVKKDGKWGYKNAAGKLIITYQFDDAGRFQNGVASVTKRGKEGLINAKGKVLIPFGKYKTIYSFFGGLAQVISQESLYGFINTKGRLAIPCKYKYASNFVDGLAQVQNNKGLGFINQSGKVIVPLIYDEVTTPFLPYDSEIKVKKNGKWGILNMHGKVLVKPIYDQLDNVVDGMRLVKKDGKYGYMNSNDKLVIKCKYDKAYTFSEGKAFVEYKGKYGTVNKYGKEKWVKN